MDSRDVGAFWDINAPVWIDLTRAGFDSWRDELNTPAFLGWLPSVAGLAGLDLACGEGHNTRAVSAMGARMTGLDLSAAFLQAAVGEERRRSAGVRYVMASADQVPFGSQSFDFVTAFMCLMDMPNLTGVLREVYRVLRSGGFLQFSIEHPVMATRGGGWVVDEQGRRAAWSLGDYFDDRPWVSEWIFHDAPPEVREGLAPFRIPRFPRTLSTWLNAVTDAGLSIESVAEPQASNAAIERRPKLETSRRFPMFLHLRCRKPQTPRARPRS